MPETGITRIILTGPTGIGKTSISLQIAGMTGLPVISADSRQCFRHLNIGTGKVSPDVRKNIRHYNIDVLNPDETDNAQAFAIRAAEWEREITASGKTPFYTGGSTLHLQSLIWPLDALPQANQNNLDTLEMLEKTRSKNHILEMLANVDPVFAGAVQGYNKHRIFRALDVWMQTGKPISSFHKQTEYSIPDSILVFILSASRETINRKINTRVDDMVNAGLLAETAGLLKMGYSPENQALQTVGYKEMIGFLNHALTLEEAISQMKTATRRYAKRQLTWFRRWEGARWLNVDTQTEQELADYIVGHL